MPQNITELFNNTAVAPQPKNLAPASFNGVIQSAAAPQSTINIGPSVPKPTYQNFLLPGETPIVSPIGGVSGGNVSGGLSPGNVLVAPIGGLGDIINSANTIAPQPETKLNGGGVTLANPFRNTSSTRVIA